MNAYQKEIASTHPKSLTVIVPTYNESQNITKILDSLRQHLSSFLETEIIVIDDNSPDGTGKIVEEYAKKDKNVNKHSVRIIHRETERGLSSAILTGIQSSKGESVVVMDSDFSHPPQTIPKMIEELHSSGCDIVV